MLTNASIALIGETGAGKTTQVGQLAKEVYKATGKRTVYTTIDRGDYDAIAHLEDLGIIKVVKFDFASDPHVFVNHVVQGEEFVDGKWVKLDRSLYGAWVFESGTSCGEECLTWLAKDQAQGKSIGGKSSYNVTLGDGVKLASNTESHYGVVQGFLREKVWQSQTLPGLVMWTFALDKAEDKQGQLMLGPLLAGHALTNMVPRWFRYTFRITGVPVEGGKPRHLLYLTSHTNGILGSYGNARVPLEGYDTLDAVIEPASLPGALERIEAIRVRAREMTMQELGL